MLSGTGKGSEMTTADVLIPSIFPLMTGAFVALSVRAKRMKLAVAVVLWFGSLAIGVFMWLVSAGVI